MSSALLLSVEAGLQEGAFSVRSKAYSGAKPTKGQEGVTIETPLGHQSTPRSMPDVVGLFITQSLILLSTRDC